MSLLSKLSNLTKNQSIEPREIFMTLPQRQKGYEYPRDVQTEVWKKWFDVRDNKNNVIKMNTGSGKTVVGLVILQSCLNEGKGPAIYVVPDNYLITQVCEEARKIGISVTTDKDDYSYTEKQAILITNVFKVINGYSVFGMRQENNYPIGSILFDDVHACIDTINDSYSIKIPSTHELYNKTIAVLEDQWRIANNQSYYDIIVNEDPTKSYLVPFWAWQSKQEDIYKLLSQYCNDENPNIYFHLPLIRNCLKTCDCYVTSKSIEIIPEGINLSQLSSLENAHRRIFMSATLSDDSVFVSTIGLERSDISQIIVPDNANDIGDRLILFPRHLNCDISNDEIKEKIQSISDKYNVVVIVPSYERAKYWDPEGKNTINKNNIETEVEKLKRNHVGLKVLVNRYDGIDLPDEACRMLVIDGLPPIKNAKERYITSVDSASNVRKREQIQRIEQGMGRGVRSNNDSCCVVLMGDALADVLLRKDGISYFSNATQEQFKLSKDLWNLLIQETPKPSIDDVFNLANYSLNREVEWIQNSKERLSEVKYSTTPSFDDNVVALRRAFEEASNLQERDAVSTINTIVKKETNNSTKGYLLQVQAKYTNLFNPVQAQQTLLCGKRTNNLIISPLEGIEYARSINRNTQSKNICTYLSENKINQNELIILVDSILDKLTFSPESDAFEKAMQDIGRILGFISTRPDKETGGAGPDNLWAIGNNRYLVIECKSSSEVTTICKDYCNQLTGSMNWFRNAYGESFSAIPIIVHPSRIVDRLASAHQQMRVIDLSMLTTMKTHIKDFIRAISQIENWLDEDKISNLLSLYKLRACDIIETYTCSYKNQ